jgi:superfamily II DNA helicase RecQ
VKQIWYFVFDKARCIAPWSTFQHAYTLLGQLDLLILECIPFYAPSATRRAGMLQHVKKTLCLPSEDTIEILRSNDRPNLHIKASFMQHAAYTYQDLKFLLWNDPETGHPKLFLIFVNYTDGVTGACTAHERRAMKDVKRDLCKSISALNLGVCQTFVKHTANDRADDRVRPWSCWTGPDRRCVASFRICTTAAPWPRH